MSETKAPEPAEYNIEGKMKWFSTVKGFGFIESPYGDIFIHKSVFKDARMEMVPVPGSRMYVAARRIDGRLRATRITHFSL
jgi:cold shock CspA family protein